MFVCLFFYFYIFFLYFYIFFSIFLQAFIVLKFPVFRMDFPERKSISQRLVLDEDMEDSGPSILLALSQPELQTSFCCTVCRNSHIQAAWDCIVSCGGFLKKVMFK